MATPCGRNTLFKAVALQVVVVSCAVCSAGFCAEESPLVLFTAITGRPGAKDAAEYLDAAQNAGFSQMMLYPRSGLESEYMGEEWLSFVGNCLAEARRRGMKVWLYDEYNWPSGSCRGRVPMENPEWTYTEYAVRKSVDGSFSWEVKRNDQMSMYDKYFDVNAYSSDAIRRFIELTHRVYESRFASYMKDGTIPGIFTDEPAHPSKMKWDDPQPVAAFRWWKELEDQYRERTGRDFRSDVEESLRDPAKSSVWEVYTELKGLQFRRAYFDQMRDWARNAGIETCGHMIAEGSPVDACNFNGLPLNSLRGLTLPGMDKIGARLAKDDEWLTYATAQYAIEHNSMPGDDTLSSHGGIELFALGPCDLTIGQMAQRIWTAALYGMDTYFMSLYHTTARGFLEKGGYAMFMSPTQPWFGHCADLHAEAKAAARQSRKRFVRKVGVRYPQRIFGSIAIRGVKWPQHPHLVPLVNELAWNQVSFELLQEDEPSALDYVFDCRIGGEFFEEKSGCTFNSPAAVRAWLEKEDRDAWRVVDERGESVPGVLVRRYADGTGVVLNLTDRDYPDLALLRGRGEPKRISLPPCSLARDVAPITSSSGIAADWDVSFDHAALQRIWFDTNGVARLTIESPVADARWVVCNLPDGKVRVVVDGRQVVAGRPAVSVPYAYEGQYRASEPFTLAAGTHELRLEGRADDSVFLPTLWLERPADLSTLASFVGCIDYSADVDVPNRSALKLRIDADGLAADVRIDGDSLGERGVGPFEWEVPESKKGGRHSFEIRLYTSVRPVFGPESVPGVRLKDRLWCPTTWNVAPRGLVCAEWRWTEKERDKHDGAVTVDFSARRAR